ncbi:MAG TPA: ATP-binding protein [Streptosporangiaceae bacterium]|nr:ATP-binding protein [Streptosporangiaceae bacterium]
MRRSVLGTMAGLATMAALAAAMIPFRSSLSVATDGLVLVVPVVIGVVLGGFVGGVISVVAGFFVYVFFFIPPYLTLWVGRPQNWAAGAVYVAVMLPVARVVAGLDAARARERRQGAELRELFQLSGLLLDDKPLGELLAAVVSTVAEVFGARQVALLLRRDGQLEVAAAVGDPLSAAQLRQALPSPGELARLGAGPDTRGDVLVHPLTAAGRPVGLLVLAAAAAAAAEPDREPLSLFANQVALAVERAQLREEVLRTRLAEEVGRLARTLVAAVSHDLRAPLARIKASSSTLADADIDIGPQARQDLAGLIDKQADRLADLVRNLLDMSRIQAGVLQPRRAPAALAGLVDGVVSDLTPALRGHPVQLDLPGELPPVDVDVTLISRVLTNLLENAVRHAPRGTPITIGARPAPPDAVLVFVADRGPGVSPDRRDEVFGLLARRDSDAGAGLGLSIAKTFIEAHGQHIWVEDAPGGGARFCFTLPAAKPPAASVIPEEARLGAGTHH